MADAIKVSEEEARRLFKATGAEFPDSESEPEPPTEPAEAEPPEEEPTFDYLDRFAKTPRKPAREAAPKTPFSPESKPRTQTNRLLSPERPVGALADRVSTLPTPGGLFPWIVILVVLLFAFVPVNGKETRLSLIWRGMTGGASVPLDALGQQVQQQRNASAEATTQAREAEKVIQDAAEGAFWTLPPGALFGIFGAAGGGSAELPSPDGLDLTLS